jgi:ATP synthase protein I
MKTLPLSSHASEGRAATVDTRDVWETGEHGLPAARRLTRQEAQALVASQPTASPWRVVMVQAAVGLAVAAFVWLLWGEKSWALSALYGAAVVVLPGVLMARGMTSRLSRMNLATGVVSFMLWEMVKISVSVVMLMLAPKLVHDLSWPALLAALVLCIKVYWLALLWRGR